MTGHLLGALARRGFEAAHAHWQPANGQSDVDGVKKILGKVPTWGVVLMAITFVLFVLLGSSVEYIIRLVYAHLAMIETPETTVEVHVYQPASVEDAKIVQNLVEAGLIEESALNPEPTITEHRNAITSSLHRTKAHITNIAGPKARWRGLPIFILYVLTVSVTGWILKKPLRLELLPLGNVMVDIFAAVFAARLHCAWTHKVISMPSDKKLRQRMISRAQWKELALPTALSAGAHGVVFEGVKIMHHFSAEACRVLDAHQINKALLVLVAVVPVLIGVAVLSLFILLPAYVTLVRKEASLLSPEEETIVPMDRTFGGRIQYIGAKLNIGDAWNSFTWEARRRLIKLYVKFFFVMSALMLLFVHLIALEFLLALGGDAKNVLQDIQSHIKM
ncbi:uncharacterized protein PV09_08815 [Verruconis gallopava]|uniref:Uncharacterized protein n=1 Tax=Verruconis gallopava TaxID=253628 RepID=A0A0D1ZZS8_9PEZI|nr:uncharacterized protein PV09_08815 [Verruconis gallopava]KIV99509.1 hypothetical protein PV09_08815 [Verruconis gallopava]